MAAYPEAADVELLPLKDLRAEDLEELLAEETGVWRERLDWDFSPSAELVKRFVRMRALGGFALSRRGRIAGYTYFVCEDRKGLIGDLYVARDPARPPGAFPAASPPYGREPIPAADAGRRDEFLVESERRLLWAAVEALAAMPRVERVESQLMMLTHPVERPLPLSSQARAHRRNFMMAGLDGASKLPPHSAAGRWHFENWSDRRNEQAAHLIASAYEGHIDSEINDQYRSIGGARRFLGNIVQYPGCGTFYQPAAWLAFDGPSSHLRGLCLASLVSHDVGHITQVCVGAEARGGGLGYELIRRSLSQLALAGCRGASLTVTASNERAVDLYLRMGFRVRRTFDAYVWNFARRPPGY